VMKRSVFALVSIAVLVSLAVWGFYLAYYSNNRSADGYAATASATSSPDSPAGTSSDSSPTAVSAHNLVLRKGPDFRVYIPWLRGRLVRTHRDVNPNFDDPDSFLLDVDSGVIHANIGDIANFLNANSSKSPLKKINLSGNGDQIKLRGTLHKIIPIPIELGGTLAVAPENRLQIHVTKLDVLKVPFQGLLGGLHIKVADLFHPQGIPGIEVSQNDIVIDTQKILPAPHVHGHLTGVQVVTPDLEEVYGNAENAVTATKEWRNFLQFRGGTIDFGKLTMHHVDLMMIDISNDPWFDLDLVHYQDQLVYGYTRMTAEAGLLIFMPDVDELPHTKSTQNISLEWLKNRNIPPPPDLYSK
jgi:hypothetical protein